MGTMIKELLVIITIAMVCGGIHIPIEEVNFHQDTTLRKCSIERNGFTRPLINPRQCGNMFPEPMCAYLYPVTVQELQEHRNDDYFVSSRCYEGPLEPPASGCASKCANCCETPKFNCTIVKTVGECDIISQLGLCDDPDMEDFVTYFCRGLCGRCEQEPFNKRLCEDDSQHCAILFGSVPCTVPYMQKNCKGTCFAVDDAECRNVIIPAPGPKLPGFDQDSSFFDLSM